MKLYHTTLKANLASINEKGIDPSYSRGPEKVVYLHTRSRTERAILHIQTRYDAPLESISVIQVDVPRSKLRREARGVWATKEPIKTYRSITDAVVFAESPIE